MASAAYPPRETLPFFLWGILQPWVRDLQFTVPLEDYSLQPLTFPLMAMWYVSTQCKKSGPFTQTRAALVKKHPGCIVSAGGRPSLSFRWLLKSCSLMCRPWPLLLWQWPDHCADCFPWDAKGQDNHVQSFKDPFINPWNTSCWCTWDTRQNWMVVQWPRGASSSPLTNCSSYTCGKSSFWRKTCLLSGSVRL